MQSTKFRGAYQARAGAPNGDTCSGKDAYLPRYLALVRADYVKLFGIVMLFLAAGLLDAIGIGLIVPALTLVFDPAGQATRDTPESELGLLFCAAFVLIFAVRAVLGFFVQHRIILYSSFKHAEIIVRLLQGYFSRPFAERFTKGSAGILKSVISSSALYTNDTLIASLRLCADVTILALIFAVLAVLQPVPLLFLCLLLGLVSVGYWLFIRKPVGDAGYNKLQAQKEMIAIAGESHQGVIDVLQYGAEQHYFGRMRASARRYATNGARYYGLLALPRFVIEFSLVLFVAGLLAVYGIYLGGVAQAVTAIGVFAAAALRVVPAVNNVIASAGQMRYSRAAMDDVFEHLRPDEDEAVAISARPGWRAFEKLEIENVSFGYGLDAQLLRHAGLVARCGETVGITGLSGAGKTTMLRVASGLLEPAVGKILLDGKEMNPETLRGTTAYVPQEPFVAEASLLENVTFFAPISEGVHWEDVRAQVEAALVAVHLDEFLESHQTDIAKRQATESGSNLSGGQRQRLAMARAIFRSRRVLLFDEPVTALDPQAVETVIATIRELKASHIILVVSHDKRVIDSCDRVYELVEGKLLERLQ